MQPLDPHTLFSIFEKGDEEIYQEHKMEELLDNPYVLMGMVLRGIENYHTMDIMHLKHFGKTYKDVRHTVRNQFYNKLFGYLNKIDDSKFEAKYTISQSFQTTDVFHGLNVLLISSSDKDFTKSCWTQHHSP